MRCVLSGLAVGVAAFLFSSAVSAHTPLLSLDDNEDGTVYVEGGFSDGSSAAGIKIVLTGKEDYKGSKEELKKQGGKLHKGRLILQEGKFDEYGEYTFEKPHREGMGIPYLVVLDAGPGHVVERDGPILTAEERKLQEKREKK